jgi:hypothetical protein
MAVSILKPKHALLVVACALLPTLLMSACSGDPFEGVADSGASAGSSNAAGGDGQGGSTVSTAGSGAGTGVACGGPEDCNDGDACTTDRCNADGICDASPMCLGTEKCCEGDCAQCCADSDCDDGISCTKNTCFAGQCMYVPDDSECQPTQYCSTQDDCRAKQVCGLVDGEDIPAVCDDGSPCTGDTCVGNFCQHSFCVSGSEQGGLCCPDKGCAKECCVDSQCNKDDDPCTVGSCSADGLCSEVALCSGDQLCCPSADDQTATCGACCSAEDCDDDVGCTEDKCGGGQCSNTPDDERCDGGYYCDPNPEKGCQKSPTCKDAAECQPPSPCQSNPSCQSGQCVFDNCADGSKCCSNGCGICCEASECDDGIACTKDACGLKGCSHEPDDTLCPGQFCDPGIGCIGCRTDVDCDDQSACTTDVCNMQTNTCLHDRACPNDQVCYNGACAQCAYDSDCQGGVITSDAAQPNFAPGNCSVSKCVSGVCKTSYVTCSGLQTCCSPFGCAIQCAATE